MAGVIEIACDESGYEGQQLVGTPTRVFAHGSVNLPWAVATDCMAFLRERIRSPATQYKANHLLREKHRAVLVWLLGPTSPAYGNAHVFLVDKHLFLTQTLLTLLLDDTEAPDPPALASAPGRPPLLVTGASASGTAALLHTQSRDPRWQAFLAAANALLRTKDPDNPTAVEAFIWSVAVLRRGGVPQAVDEILALLEAARPQAEAYRLSLRDNPPTFPPLDLLAPAIRDAVAHWGRASIVHDRQNTLSPVRVARLKETIPDLVDLTLVNYETDPRVQLADIVAGTIRRITEDHLSDHGDPELLALTSPYVTDSSIRATPQPR